jgi:hypothetical protein
MLDTTKCEAYLAEVRAFAAKRGLSDQLEQQLKHMARFFDHDETGRARTELRKDFAPYSFLFDVFRKTENFDIHIFNGGCIYFGPGDTGSGAPQFTCRIGDVSEGWSCHT